VAVTVVFLLWKLPEWQADRATDITAPKDRVNLENELRRTLATVIAGAFVLFSGFIAWRNMRLLQEGQITAREGQITERFTRAIEQLGATHDDGSPRLEVRLGGIYALERIARESDVDHGPVMEILTAYVREHTRSSPQTLSNGESGADPQTQRGETGTPRMGVQAIVEMIDRRIGAAGSPGDKARNQSDPPEQQIRVDVQAVMTVIGRRTRTFGLGETQILDLAGVQLQGVYLDTAKLRFANFLGANLSGARFMESDLRGAGLWEADLSETSFYLSDLSRAILVRANCRKAIFWKADLSGANLREVDFSAADLREANFSGAELAEAHLEGADLTDSTGLETAYVHGATWDQNTRFPRGWSDGKPPPEPIEDRRP
jgi:uncharacterized protein YjbI with pentapeptide repeats